MALQITAALPLLISLCSHPPLPGVPGGKAERVGISQSLQISKYCNPMQENLCAKHRTSSNIIADNFLISVKHKVRGMHQDSCQLLLVVISRQG